MPVLAPSSWSSSTSRSQVQCSLLSVKFVWRKRKQMDVESFDKLWKVMSKTEYDRVFKNNLYDRQMGKMKYEWWKDEETYLDIEAPITKSGENNGGKTKG